MSAWCVKCNIYIEIFIVYWLTLCSPVDITEGEDVNSKYYVLLAWVPLRLNIV